MPSAVARLRLLMEACVRLGITWHRSMKFMNRRTWLITQLWALRLMTPEVARQSITSGGSEQAPCPVLATVTPGPIRRPRIPGPLWLSPATGAALQLSLASGRPTEDRPRVVLLPVSGAYKISESAISFERLARDVLTLCAAAGLLGEGSPSYAAGGFCGQFCAGFGQRC